MSEEKKSLPMEEQLRKGIKVEMEHTSDRRVAEQIARDHLKESPCYYDYLAYVEKMMKSEGCPAKLGGTPAREKNVSSFTNWVVQVRTRRGKKHISSYGVGSQKEALEKAKKDAEQIYFENAESRREVVVKSPPDSKAPDKVIRFS